MDWNFLQQWLRKRMWNTAVGLMHVKAMDYLLYHSFFLKMALEAKLKLDRLSTYCPTKVQITKRERSQNLKCKGFSFFIYHICHLEEIWYALSRALQTWNINLIMPSMRLCDITHCSTLIVSLSNYWSISALPFNTFLRCQYIYSTYFYVHLI